LDSFGETTYLGGGCGGMYASKDPDTMDVIESLKGKPECKYTLASLPPLEWQTYDVEYRVDKKDGKDVGQPHVTVYHNGIKIHDNFTPRRDANGVTDPTTRAAEHRYTPCLGASHRPLLRGLRTPFACAAMMAP
jgi:hypothetical protein